MNISRNKFHLQIFVIFSLSCLFFVHTANALSVVATIPVDSGPAFVAYDSAKGEIFVANNGGGTVSVINDGTNAVVATIPVGTNPIGITYDSAKGEIFVANNFDDTVSVINHNTNAVVATIPVGTSPFDAAYDSAKGEIFVANSGDGTVSVINHNTNAVVATIPVGTNPRGVAYDSVKGEIFVANSGAGTVSVVNDATNAVVSTIPVGTSPFGVAYDSAKSEIFVANNGGNTVSVIGDGTNTVVSTIPVGTNPDGLAYDIDKGEIFVANNGGNTVSVINDGTNTVVSTIPVGTSPFGVAYDSAKGEIFVSNNGDDTVSVISDPIGGSDPHGNDVTIHHPPSLGNDYYHHFAGGVNLNGKSFDITKWGVTIPQQVLKIGQQDNFTFKIYDERGGSTVSHVGMYIHFKGDASVANSDTSISWDKHDGIQINDGGKFFSDIAVSEHHDDNFAYVSIKFTPQKIMSDSSILMRMWDDKLASVDLPINGAIIIVDPNAPVPVKQVPTDQYGDYHILVSLLDSDGYQMPPILHRIKDGSDLGPAVDVYWIYDKGVDKLVMVETFKGGDIIGDTVFNLQKKPAGPVLTDHDYIYIPAQNNRQDPSQEKSVMVQEELKAEKLLESMHVVVK
jgi:YVTN family beta-propeller protein